MVLGYTLVYHKLQYNAKVFQVHMHAIHGDLCNKHDLYCIYAVIYSKSDIIENCDVLMTTIAMLKFT